MNLKHFNQDNNAIVGSYLPSENWSKFTQFAVMDEKTGALIACCGYFQEINNPQQTFDFKDYKHAAECIEQAQLYANAPSLFLALKNLLSNPTNAEYLEQSRELLSRVVDISEPATRLLGVDSMKVINHVKNL